MDHRYANPRILYRSICVDMTPSVLLMCEKSPVAYTAIKGRTNSNDEPDYRETYAPGVSRPADAVEESQAVG